MQTNIGTIFSGLFEPVKTEVGKEILPDLGQTAVAIIANPTKANAIAQGFVLLDKLLTSTVSTTTVTPVIQDLATVLGAEVQDLITGEIAKLSTPPAKAA